MILDYNDKNHNSITMTTMDNRAQIKVTRPCSCPPCPTGGGREHGERGCPFSQKLDFKTRFLLTSIRLRHFLSTFAKILPSCSKNECQFNSGTTRCINRINIIYLSTVKSSVTKLYDTYNTRYTFN